MRFVDEAEIDVFGGNGGNGSVHWRREKFVPQGGPDGGDGGNGGAVVFVADSGLNTLLDFQLAPLLRAEDGETGGASQSKGRDGVDAEYPVPVGTQVFFGDRLVADLSVPAARWVAARGGRGGKGNAFYKSATRQAPDFAQKGRPGEHFPFRLELKSVADVGLVGLPNAGKSTLISKISRAHPKIADYPFTTVQPHLGVVALDDDRRLVVADIPGLIPGAHEGKGLGLKFLKHIERTLIIAHLIDASQISTAPAEPDPADERLLELVVSQFNEIDRELELFSADLTRLPRVIVFSKADIPLCRRAYAAAADYFHTARGLEPFLISSATGEGLEALTERLWALSREHGPGNAPENSDANEQTANANIERQHRTPT